MRWAQERDGALQPADGCADARDQLGAGEHWRHDLALDVHSRALGERDHRESHGAPGRRDWSAPVPGMTCRVHDGRGAATDGSARSRKFVRRCTRRARRADKSPTGKVKRASS